MLYKKADKHSHFLPSILLLVLGADSQEHTQDAVKGFRQSNTQDITAWLKK